MSKKIIVAIDEIELSRAKNILNKLDNKKCLIKIGSVAFNSLGHKIITYAEEKGFEIFLDLKLHDIPNTVKKSIHSLINLPIKMLTIHTSGGREMMQSAIEAVKDKNIKIIGVTALTSLNQDETSKIYNRNINEQVKEMLDLAHLAGIDGIVCSPHELKLVKENYSFLKITPGIRMHHLNDDQKRVMTPKEAIESGADYIVVGRPITMSRNIEQSLDEIYLSIK